MFCPKCGKSDQQKDSYCRNCGMFLPDFEKVKKSQTTPEQHLTANLVLNFMTAIASLSLAILLYSFVIDRGETSPIIYVTAGFLTAMFAWQVQIIIRTFMVKKHLKKRANPEQMPDSVKTFEAAKTREFLNEADTTNLVDASVTENTTRNLNKIPRQL